MIDEKNINTENKQINDFLKQTSILMITLILRRSRKWLLKTNINAKNKQITEC